MKKLNFSCGPARCLKLVIWPTDKKCCTPLLYAKSGGFPEEIMLPKLGWKLQKLFEGLVMKIKTILNTPFSQAVVMEECFRHCLLVGKRPQELKQHNKQFVLDHRCVTEEQCANIWCFVRHALTKKCKQSILWTVLFSTKTFLQPRTTIAFDVTTFAKAVFTIVTGGNVRLYR